MTTTPEARAYSRGYYAGSHNAWHVHRPPHPPHALVRAVFEASRALRDEADAMIASWDEDDEGAVPVAAAIDKLDEAMTAVGRWLRDMEVTP